MNKKAKTATATTSANSFSLAIHGGAGGKLARARKHEAAIRNSMEGILEQGRKVLARGGSALDAVTLCVRLLEDDPQFNAGYGAIANSAGRYELDASIMDGRTLRAGAVAAVENVRNPVLLARLVMEKTPHVMLAAKGAADFARANSITMVTQRYFRAGTRKALETHDPVKKAGTVGAVARDLHGNLAAATSTGGHSGKMPGRVGDTPVIGAGNFADNESCAISCTGIGEHFMRTVTSGYAGFLIEYDGMEAANAAQATIDRLARRVRGDGAFIMVDKNGRVAAAQNSTVMRCGWIEQGGPAVTTLQAPIRARKP